MKKYILLFSVVGITVFFSCRHRQVFATAKNGKSLLWEVSGRNLKKPSYFLGTMHLMCAEDAILSKNTQSIIKAIDQIYLEVDMDNASELLSGVISLTHQNDTSLHNVLPDEDYQKIKAFFEKYQPSVPFTVLETQPPLMLSASVFEILLPCEQKGGIEMKIIDAAYQQKKVTKGLETMAFQAEIFNQIPYQIQARELVSTIDSLDKNRNSMNELMAAYNSQDVEKLYSLTLSDKSTNAYLDLLVNNRNKNWVNQFDSIAADSSTLFAVGAGHLGGEKGVLQLLKNQGYTIRPLIND